MTPVLIEIPDEVLIEAMLGGLSEDDVLYPDIGEEN